VPIDAIDEQIRACLNRNLYESAFDLIVTHFSDKIMHLTYSIVSNDAFVEDAVQDVLLRVCGGCRRTAGRLPFQPGYTRSHAIHA